MNLNQDIFDIMLANQQCEVFSKSYNKTLMCNHLTMISFITDGVW